MKTKSILLSLLAIASGICAFAQENDDMYFGSKDRAKVSLTSREEVVLASAKANPSAQTINPSDSYSARNENPDYIAGAKVGSNATTSSSYFTPTYQPNVNQSLYSNTCSCSNTGYNNSSAYGSSYGYSPYSSMYGMGGYGSPYSSMYGMGGMGYGMGMSYGMGMGYGMGSMMSYGLGFGYSSMYGMSPYMSMSYGMYGYNPYMMGYGYPSTVVVVNHNEAGPVYGRHPSRSSTPSISHYTSASSSRGGTAYYNGSGGTRSSAGSRVSSNSTSYYNNAWKQNSSSPRSSWGNTGSNSGARSSWNNSNTNSSWSNSGARSSWGNPSFGNSSFGGARSSGFSGGGGGGFSGGGGGHSGGGGHGRR